MNQDIDLTKYYNFTSHELFDLLESFIKLYFIRLQLDNLNLNLILKSTFGTFCKTDLLISPAGNCKTCYFNR